jgi:hypothetical protein
MPRPVLSDSIMRCRSFVLAGSLAASLSFAQPVAQPTPFDGDWLVSMSCPSNTENSAARGYKRQFPATVRDGVLHGEIGVAEAPGWLRIEGRVDGDGSALLEASGRTGDPDFAVAHPPSSTAYAYRIEARFEPSRGTGKRLDQRVCSFVFERK